MPVALRDDVFFCLTDRCAVFLDLAANRYFGLSASADLALRRIVAGDALDPELHRALTPAFVNRLVIEAEGVTRLEPPRKEPPTAELSGADGVARLGTVARALILRAMIAVEMRAVGLRAMVRRRRARKMSGSPLFGEADSPGTLGAVLAAHRRADHIAGAANRCLVRSLALIDHLARHHHYPDLVIGVRTGAFAAHCWIQDGATVLNDEIDRVRLYTPIMIL